jgi:2-polyprenyl-3-methyl-5-hydroxy-6-metoxy-1,4-benzoquinol methylase
MFKIIDTFEKIRDAVKITELAKTLSAKQVLEIGCGGGERTALFVEAGCNITAIDIIDFRKPEFTTGYNFIIADGRDLPFKNETFDAIVSFDVIEHISEDLLFLSEIYRACKKGEILVLGTPNRNRLSHKIRQFLGKKVVYPLHLGEGCIHLREYTMSELTDLVKKVGFEIIDEEYIWLGLVGFPGFKLFPAFLNRWVQYLLVSAMKI